MTLSTPVLRCLILMAKPFVNATDFMKRFLSSDLHLPAPFPTPDFSVPFPSVGSRPAAAPAPSPVTLVEVTKGKCNSLWEPRVLTQICFFTGSQDGWGLCSAPVLAAAMQDEAGTFSPVTNYPFTLLNGKSLALFCQRFINPVAAFLREGRKVSSHKYPLREPQAKALLSTERGLRPPRDPGLGLAWSWGPLRTGAEGARPRLRRTFELYGVGGTPSLLHHLCLCYMGRVGAAPWGAQTRGTGWGALPACRRCSAVPTVT